MDRRAMLLAGVGAPALFAAEGVSAQARQQGAKTYLLVHGAWHGGRCWRDVADALRAQGHRVFAPTQTGLGERRHLLSRDVTLDVFVGDVANLMEAEELGGAILVGHSFGGGAISGVADGCRGPCAFGMLPPEVVAARRKQIAEQGSGVSILAPPLSAFGIP